MSTPRSRLDPDAHRPILPPLPPEGWWARPLIGAALRERAASVTLDDRGHGYDRFGMSRGGVAGGLAITRFLYDHWFRVEHFGIEQVPTEGPVVVASNHSGTVPLDALMVWCDLVRHCPGGRVPRPVMDHFVPNLPIVSTTFTRAGGIGGSRGNFHALLDAGEMLLVFPEGVPGIGKPFRERYRLQRWREGHAELAIRHAAPVVPVAVIGAEEQMPQVARIEAIKLLGSPYLPIPLTLFPLPVRYRIWYGAPIHLERDYRPDQASDPQVVAEAALRVRDAVQALIDRGLAARPGVFR